MSTVRFVVHHSFQSSARQVWDELVDWSGHAEWVPATRVKVRSDDPTAVGAEFTAVTGYGPLALQDRMRVVRCDWNDATSVGDCEVAKIGPVLRGSAGFTVRPDGTGASVEWVEDVTVRYLPRLLARPASRIGAAGFKLSMRRLNALLQSSAKPSN